MFPNNSVTCMSPWHSIRILPSGAVKYCDAAIEQYDQIEDDDYLRWWQAGYKSSNVRKNIQQGKSCPGCKRCYDGNKYSESTYRSKKNFQGAIHHGKFLKNSLAQSPAFKIMQKIDLKGHLPTHISLSFSNDCNASCFMCSPRFSNKVAMDHNDFGLVHDKKINLSWDNKEAKMNNIMSMIKNNDRLLYLKINGGEPFLQKECEELIKRVVESNKTNIKLVINTNGTIWNQKLLELLVKFDYCAIDIAIETYHEDNNYIRKGCNTDIVKNNIKKFLNLRKPNKFEIYIHPVPQLLSIFNLDTLIDYCNEHTAPMLAQPIFDPRYMQIDVLPIDLRLEILEEWTKKYNITNQKIYQNEDVNFTAEENLKSISNQLNKNLQNIVTYLINFLKSPEPDNVLELRKQLFDHIKKFDKKHNTDFKKTFPRLASLYDQHIV